MLDRFTWGNYWTLIIAVLAIYYLFVFLLFFKKGFFTRQVRTLPVDSGRRQPVAYTEPVELDNETRYADPGSNPSSRQDDENTYMPLVHELTQEVKTFLVNKSKGSFVKEEIVLGIQLIMEDYKKLADTSFYKTISDFIRFECETACSIAIDESDIRRIWLG